METKEVIEKVKDKYEGWQGYARTQKEVDKLGEERDKVIELLQRGEKFEKMWEEFNKEYALYHLQYTNDNIHQAMKRLKQKYFPKPSKDFTEKVMAKINKGEAKDD